MMHKNYYYLIAGIIVLMVMDHFMVLISDFTQSRIESYGMPSLSTPSFISKSLKRISPSPKVRQDVDAVISEAVSGRDTGRCFDLGFHTPSYAECILAVANYTRKANLCSLIDPDNKLIIECASSLALSSGNRQDCLPLGVTTKNYAKCITQLAVKFGSRGLCSRIPKNSPEYADCVYKSENDDQVKCNLYAGTPKYGECIIRLAKSAGKAGRCARLGKGSPEYADCVTQVALKIGLPNKCILLGKNTQYYKDCRQAFKKLK
ncbi:MAG: hypothetical protein ABIH11_07855 [Candidatus Altiarchaeota archaeon]